MIDGAAVAPGIEDIEAAPVILGGRRADGVWGIPTPFECDRGVIRCAIGDDLYV